MRLINITFKIEDNDLIEHSFRNHMEAEFKDSIHSIKTLPNTDHLKDNKMFKALLKAKKQANTNLDRFNNNNRK